MMDTQTRTFFCVDLFTRSDSGEQALTPTDMLEPSGAFRKAMDYFAHALIPAALLARLAAEKLNTLACMHAWHCME